MSTLRTSARPAISRQPASFHSAVTFPSVTASLAAKAAAFCADAAAPGKLPRRTIAALSSALVLVSACALLLGPSLRSVMAESDDYADHLRSLRGERGQAIARPAAFAPMRSLFYFPPAARAPRVSAYAPAPKPLQFGPFGAKRSGGFSAPRSAATVSLNLKPTSAASADAGALSRRSVCVRLCDGYHFPVGDYSGESDDAAHSAICAGMCPGAPTRLYVVSAGTDKIDDAISIRDHRPYRSLPVAFRHTTTRDNTCSCRGPGESVVDNVSLMKDFTLRRGDKVMTQLGFKVFRGSTTAPYQKADFTGLANFPGISNKERYQLSAIERASGVSKGLAYTPRKSVEKASLGINPEASAVVLRNGKLVRLIGPQAMLSDRAVPAIP